MKFPDKIIAAAVSALISICPFSALPVNAAVSPDLINITDENNQSLAVSAEEAGIIIRSEMKKRNETISLKVPLSLIGSKSDINNMISSAFEETGNSTEGDYLRWSIDSYSFSAVPNVSEKVYDLQFSISYYTTAAQEAELDKAVEKLYDALELKGKCSYDKIKIIYGYVTDNVRYADDTSQNEVFSAYGALINGEAVCQGNSQLLYRLLTGCGISCRFIPGMGNIENHAWNIARLGDYYYFLDSTWDEGNSGNYCYFMRGSDDMDTLDPYNSHSSMLWADYNAPLYCDYDPESFWKRYPLSPDALVMPEYSMGDIDSNGIVEASDASAVLTAYAELSTKGKSGLDWIQEMVADTNADGKIDAGDASDILSYYSFLSTGGTLSLYEFLKKI